MRRGEASSQRCYAVPLVPLLSIHDLNLSNMRDQMVVYDDVGCGILLLGPVSL